ncbi:phosphomannomutase [Pseudorhodobacter antarcticus]|uniref:Phosphomannomutase n=1 Tax=Pseudorhodobacter antarcticus TaxID=1077947 RepID=A0A1H8G9L3_9RHOB|nr:phosphomannomutase/phosphoglucomutase [Pseudorhodobacter antarcticus]SEN40726.1 phosphomannomutase [Pseudorhodobacter antarcticus]
MTALTCFKAYDIRGRLGAELNAEIAERIARAFAQVLGAERVVVGHDPRQSSAELIAAVKTGLVKAGVEVLDLGLCGTEEMYHATSYFEADGGIEVTASHNPMDYNGMKLVGKGSRPLDPGTDMHAIRALAEAGNFAPEKPGGEVRPAKAARGAYVRAVLSFIDVTALRPMKILVNAGNGAAGPTFDELATALSKRRAPLSFICLNHEPDGSFPNGIPNPLLPENQPMTANAVLAAGADLGIAWDGDFDRCFLFDHLGRFVPGEYIVGLLAEVFLAKEPGAKIIHDPRVLWNTVDVVTRLGGTPLMARTGHAYLKQAMRDTGAVYGGEMSAHHYFRDFACCDSGMIPWLLIVELMSRRGVSLADLVSARMAAFPSSGEINFHSDDPAGARDRVLADLAGQVIARDDTDGLSLDMGDWRLNLRTSNTETLLRLNVESRGDPVKLANAVARLRGLIQR